MTQATLHRLSRPPRAYFANTTAILHYLSPSPHILRYNSKQLLLTSQRHFLPSNKPAIPPARVIHDPILLPSRLPATPYVSTPPQQGPRTSVIPHDNTIQSASHLIPLLFFRQGSIRDADATVREECCSSAVWAAGGAVAGAGNARVRSPSKLTDGPY